MRANLSVVASNPIPVPPSPKPKAKPWIGEDTIRELREEWDKPERRTACGDRAAKGLGLVKRPGATGPAFHFDFVARHAESVVKIKLGTWPVTTFEEAREQARKLVDEGRDPRIAVAAEKAAIVAEEEAHHESEGMTLRVALESKMASGIRPNTVANYRKLLSKATKVNLIAFADRPLASIAKREWRAVFDRAKAVYGTDSPTPANLKRLVSGIYLHALDQSDYLKLDLGFRDIDVRGNEKRRDDRLKREQLAPWFAELAKLHPTTAHLARFYLFTGLRDREARYLRWSEVEPTCIRIPGERMKKGKEHVLPRTAAINLILDEQSKWKHKCEWVFPSQQHRAKRSRWDVPLASITRVLRPLGCSTHGLRRTVATFLDHLEVPENVRRHILAQARDVARGDVVRDLPVMQKHLTAYHGWIAEQRLRGKEDENHRAAYADEKPTPEQLKEWAAQDKYDREQAREAWL
ncbi:MAG: tyrosine-type recombinase/integrase [Panacagrimonas sp.]